MHKNTNKILAAILITLTIFNVFLFFLMGRENQHATHPLLYPYLDNLNDDEFRQVQKFYRTDFKDLLHEVESKITTEDGAKYSFYFQSLNSGASVGIRDREHYVPGSLKKVPLLAAAMKKVEQGDLSLDQAVTIRQQNLNDKSGALYLKGPGLNLTVRDLMNEIAKNSDNTATLALYDIVGEESYLETMFNMGLSYKTFMNTQKEYGGPVSAKEYSNVFRSLYYSTVLDQDDSEYLLRLMINTSYEKGLPAGVPEGVVVSHKIGFFETQHHDCGIIYYPESPYILCVMTIGLSQEKADQLSKDISNITYNYVDQIMKQ